MKERNTKQLMALILAVVMILSNIPVVGLAEEQTYCGLEHTHEAACYEAPSAPKTHLEKLLAAQSLQDLYNLLEGSPTATQKLSVSELSLVRQRADTIYAELALTEDDKTVYRLITERVYELVDQHTEEEKKNLTKLPEEDTSPAPEIPNVI